MMYSISSYNAVCCYVPPQGGSLWCMHISRLSVVCCTLLFATGYISTSCFLYQTRLRWAWCWGEPWTARSWRRATMSTSSARSRPTRHPAESSGKKRRASFFFYQTVHMHWFGGGGYVCCGHLVKYCEKGNSYEKGGGMGRNVKEKGITRKD